MPTVCGPLSEYGDDERFAYHNFGPIRGRPVGVIGCSSLYTGGTSTAAFERLVSYGIEMLREYRPSVVLSGMGLGYEVAVAEAAHRLRIPLCCYFTNPSAGFNWSGVWYRTVKALRAVYPCRYVSMSSQNETWHPLSRNEKLVTDLEQSGVLATLLSYDKHWGRTQARIVMHAIRLCRRRCIRIDNHWEAWEDFISTRPITGGLPSLRSPRR